MTISHTVLAGPISRLAPGQHTLCHFETVRHIPRPHACHLLFERAWVLTQRDDARLPLISHDCCFGLHSYRYWTLNPGQEDTDPKLSPRDPVSAIRGDERGGGGGMDTNNVV